MCFAAVVTFQPYLRESSVRLVAGILLVFFLPGYALQAVLFRPSDDDRLSPRTRLAMAIGSSPALVALVALALNELTGRITFGGMLTALVSLTGALLGVALFQTARMHQKALRPATGHGLLSDHRFIDHLPRPAVWTTGESQSRKQWALVGVAAILFIGLLTAPAPQQTYTELSLLTETAQGQLTANGYPETLTTGTSTTVVATVRNEEQTTQDYLLVVTREQTDSNKMILMTERVKLSDGKMERLQTTLVAPQKPGEVRFTYHLYRTADVGQVDRAGNLPSPYRETQLLVTIRSPADGDTT
jgi:uncharacterized membrane protein